MGLTGSERVVVGFGRDVGMGIRNSERLGGFGRVLGLCGGRVGGALGTNLLLASSACSVLLFSTPGWGVGMCFTIVDWSFVSLSSFLFDTTKLSMLQHFFILLYSQ